MKLAVMQPYFFPYIGYWQLINAVDTFVIYDDVNFIKKSFINRNTILVNSSAQLFTLELMGASQNKLINKIEVGKNRIKLLKTIEMAYKKAPNFDNVYPMIEDILMLEENNLAKYIGHSLKRISNYLGINTKFVYSSEIMKNNTLKGEEKIINIASSLKAKYYINAIGGRELYEKENFKKENIELKFLQTRSVEYRQFEETFIPSLSIIDMLMFNSKESINDHLKEYDLV